MFCDCDLFIFSSKSSELLWMSVIWNPFQSLFQRNAFKWSFSFPQSFCSEPVQRNIWSDLWCHQKKNIFKWAGLIWAETKTRIFHLIVWVIFSPAWTLFVKHYNKTVPLKDSATVKYCVIILSSIKWSVSLKSSQYQI